MRRWWKRTDEAGRRLTEAVFPACPANGGGYLPGLREKRLVRNQQGQDLIEYALMVGFIAVIIGAMVPSQLLPPLQQIWNSIMSILGDAPASGS